MQKEVEAKLKIKNNSLEKIREVLKGASETSETIELKDEYFSANNSISNNFSLIRIRTKTSSQQTHSILTFKSKSEDTNGIWHRNEFETEVQDPKVLREMFSALNLKLTRSNQSIRNIFTLKDQTRVEIINYSVPVPIEMIEVESDRESKIDTAVKMLENYAEIAGEDIFKPFDDFYKNNPT